MGKWDIIPSSITDFLHHRVQYYINITMQYILYEYYGVFFELKENDVMLSMHPHVFHYNKLKFGNLKTGRYLDELITL